MKNQQTETQEQKEVVAVSKAAYRGFEIFETQEGCTFFVGKKQYDCVNLDEATAAIDAIYTYAARRVTM